MTNPQSPIPNPQLPALIATALAEDIGAGDITSQLLIPAEAKATLEFVAREELVVCGKDIPTEVYRQLDANLWVETCVQDGELVSRGTVLAIATGNARLLLAGERTALNLMQRMSGVGTLTRKFVEAVKGTGAVILDTRKTMPGLRVMDKYAVRMGGGQNHRMRLDDMVLIKDNHLGMRHEALGIREAIAQARNGLSSLMPNASCLMPIVVECDTLEQVKEAIAAKPDRILLDNMDVLTLRAAVKLAAEHVPLEASGGVTLANVRTIAETGVDYISVGALTHSAVAVDIGADIKIN